MKNVCSLLIILLCSCAYGVDQAPEKTVSVLDSGAVKVDAGTDQDIESTNEAGFDVFFIGIPDANPYSPTYKCINDQFFLECDNPNDPFDCTLKNCNVNLSAPVCVYPGKCIQN